MDKDFREAALEAFKKSAMAAAKEHEQKEGAVQTPGAESSAPPPADAVPAAAAIPVATGAEPPATVVLGPAAEGEPVAGGGAAKADTGGDGATVGKSKGGATKPGARPQGGLRPGAFSAAGKKAGLPAGKTQSAPTDKISSADDKDAGRVKPQPPVIVPAAIVPQTRRVEKVAREGRELVVISLVVQLILLLLVGFISIKVVHLETGLQKQARELDEIQAQTLAEILKYSRVKFSVYQDAQKGLQAVLVTYDENGRILKLQVAPIRPEEVPTPDAASAAGAKTPASSPAAPASAPKK